MTRNLLENSDSPEESPVRSPAVIHVDADTAPREAIDEVRDRLDPADLRSSDARRRNLQTFASLVADQTINVNLAPIGTAWINQHLLPPEMCITCRKVPQVGTDYSRIAFDRILQYGMAAHECAHARYTDERAKMSHLDRIDSRFKGAAKHFWNILEDGAIEEQLRHDFSNGKVGQWLDILSKNFRDDHEYGIEYLLEQLPDDIRDTIPEQIFDEIDSLSEQTTALPFLNAVMVAVMDLAVYNSGRLCKLIDPENTDYVFRSDQERDIFLEFLPRLSETSIAVLSTADAVRRTDIIFECWADLQQILQDEDLVDQVGEVPDQPGGENGRPNDADNDVGQGAEPALGLGEVDGSVVRERIRNVIEGEDSPGAIREIADDAVRSPEDGTEGEADDSSEVDVDEPGSAEDEENDDVPNDTGSSGDVSEDDQGSGSESESPEDVYADEGEDEGPSEQTLDAWFDAAKSDPSTDSEPAHDTTDEDGTSDHGDSSDSGSASEPSTGESGSNGGYDPRPAPGVDTTPDREETLEAEQEARAAEEARESAAIDEGTVSEMQVWSELFDQQAGNNSAGGGPLTGVDFVLPTEIGASDGWAQAQNRAATLIQPLDNKLQMERRARKRRNQRRGSLDTKKLHKPALGDTRVFRTTHQGGEKDYAAVVLLDRSSSMKGTDIKAAQDALGAYAYALEAVGVDVCIIDMYRNRARIISPFGTPIRTAKSLIFSDKASGGTPLAEALRLARVRLDRYGGNTFIVTITDGLPNSEATYRRELRQCSMPVLGVILATEGTPDSEWVTHQKSLYHATAIVRNRTAVDTALQTVTYGIMF